MPDLGEDLYRRAGRVVLKSAPCTGSGQPSSSGQLRPSVPTLPRPMLLLGLAALIVLRLAHEVSFIPDAIHHGGRYSRKFLT